MNVFARQLSLETGTGIFARDILIQTNNLELWLDATRNLAEQSGRKPFGPSPMASMLRMWRGLDQRNVTTAQAQAMAELLAGRSASDYFGRRRSTISTLLGQIELAQEALTRIRGALTGIRNNLKAWQDEGLIERTIARMQECARVCGAPALAEAGRLFQQRHGTLFAIIQPVVFETSAVGVMPDWQQFRSRLTLLHAYFEQYATYVNEAAWLARYRADSLVGLVARTGAAWPVPQEVERAQDAWQNHEVRSIAILNDEMQDYRITGRSNLVGQLRLIQDHLDPQRGLRRVWLAYEEHCAHMAAGR